MWTVVTVYSALIFAGYWLTQPLEAWLIFWFLLMVHGLLWLQLVLVATCSLSLLGRLDANMFTDRVLEYVNNIQQGSKKNASAASFGKALDMTTLLKSILHVRHAFQATESGAAERENAGGLHGASGGVKLAEAQAAREEGRVRAVQGVAAARQRGARRGRPVQARGAPAAVPRN